MSTVPQPLQLRPEDAPGLKPAALSAVNTYLRQVQQGLSGKLTLSENHVATVKELSVTTVDGWKLPSAYTNSWATAGVTHYRKTSDGLVELTLQLALGHTDQAAFQLEAPYRPSVSLIVPAYVITSGFAQQCRRFTVGTDGLVVPLGLDDVTGTLAFTAQVMWTANDRSAISTLATPLTFKHGLAGRCTDLLLTSCQDARAGGSTLLPFPGLPRWYDDGNGNVVVLDIAGLYGAATFTVRFVCLGEPQ